jgi:hypothetical protein
MAQYDRKQRQKELALIAEKLLQKATGTDAGSCADLIPRLFDDAQQLSTAERAELDARARAMRAKGDPESMHDPHIGLHRGADAILRQLQEAAAASKA